MQNELRDDIKLHLNVSLSFKHQNKETVQMLLKQYLTHTVVIKEKISSHELRRLITIKVGHQHRVWKARNKAHTALLPSSHPDTALDNALPHFERSTPHIFAHGDRVRCYGRHKENCKILMFVGTVVHDASVETRFQFTPHGDGECVSVTRIVDATTCKTLEVVKHIFVLWPTSSMSIVNPPTQELAATPVLTKARKKSQTTRDIKCLVCKTGALNTKNLISSLCVRGISPPFSA